MIVPEFFCKMYTRHTQCPGYARGECRACYNADAIMTIMCDRCKFAIDPNEEYKEENGKHYCKKCMEKIGVGNSG